MFIAILGRQPEFGAAELERLYGAANVHWFSNQSMLVKSDSFDFNRLGGSLKAGRVVFESRGNWRELSEQLTTHYSKIWSGAEHKITLGISAYGLEVAPCQLQQCGINLKKQLQRCGVSLRLIPNNQAALNTATSHHNKLGLSPHKVELLIVRAKSGRIIVAESVGAQNISALAARDQKRPKTDAFVGMLPPKLARIMVNLASLPLQSPASASNHRENIHTSPNPALILDPFCGTGTVLQEALLEGYDVLGSDLSSKMIDYTAENLAWLQRKFQPRGKIIALTPGDATKFQWQTRRTIDAVVCETYLGQPFSAPPRPEKLRKVAANCNHIITEFLKNLRPQLSSQTTLVLAVPAWRDHAGNFTHLPLLNQLENLGYQPIPLQHVRSSNLIYYRENQVVAREILILSPRSSSAKSP